jgi:thymidine kinase
MAKLYFYYSAMNAGKSTVLLQSSYNYQERGMRTLVFVPAIDTRAGLGRVRSRIGLESPAEVLTPTDNILNRVRHEHKNVVDTHAPRRRALRPKPGRAL